jgi:ectoine hydroxylase-related dioxygenase (phytanoyl-CoA dioxygenase family)
MGVLTVWTPFGDLGYEHGTLAVVPGSHRLPGYQRVRDTYGRMDVDRDRVSGWFANDPLDVTGRYGGGWATTEFRAGDVLIFGMHMMHMSLTNTSGEFRLTADTRWQKAGDPVDERWIGKLPKGHYAWHSEPEKMVAMADKRREWGV